MILNWNVKRNNVSICTHHYILFSSRNILKPHSSEPGSYALYIIFFERLITKTHQSSSNNQLYYLHLHLVLIMSSHFRLSGETTDCRLGTRNWLRCLCPDCLLWRVLTLRLRLRHGPGVWRHVGHIVQKIALSRTRRLKVCSTVFQPIQLRDLS